MQPILVTSRLELRPFTIDDAPAVQALAGAREIADTTVTIPHPYEDGVAERWIASHAPAYAEGRRITYAVVQRLEGRLIGAIGLAIDADHARGELGYWIGVPYWNRGYASEAAREMVRFAFDELALNRVFAHHLVRNPASGRVMQKVGMQYEGRLRQHVQRWGRFEDVDGYGLLASDLGRSWPHP